MKTELFHSLDDFLEAFLQWSVGQAVTLAKMMEFNNEYAQRLLQNLDALSEALNLVDLGTHIKAYKESIKGGHGIVVVAHSQGNFFTNKAYEYLDDWMKPYFHMIGVASPAVTVAGNGPRVSWDNDLVPLVSLAPWTLKNPNRKRGINAVGEIIDMPSISYHAFAYYMGGEVEETDLEVKKMFSTDKAKKEILKFIVDAVVAHKNTPSQYLPKSTDLCMVGTMRPMEHRHNAMPDLQSVYFHELGKIRTIDGRYIMSKCTDTNNTNATAKDGIVTVGLTWKYPEIDMDLAFTAGTKDLSDLNNTAFEHYYVENKEQMPPDTYPIEVNKKGTVDGRCLKTNPETLVLTVKTPDGGDMLAAVVEGKLSLL